MTRFKAFLLHFILSLSIFSAVILVVVFLWYPSVYLQASGVWQALRVVALVDVCLGPLMTLILFRKNKPGLKFDLSVVALVQVVALCYGVWVLNSQRPVLTVFYDGMFMCLDESQVAFAGAGGDAFSDHKHAVPIAVLPPLSAERQLEWQQRSQTLPEGYPKVPAYVYGEQLVAYDKQSLPQVLKDEWDLSRELELSEHARLEWQKYQRKYGQDADHAFFVLTCGFQQYMAAVDRSSGVIEDALDISFANAQKKRLIKKSSQ